MVDLVGLEPTTSSMPWKRAPSCATGPLFLASFSRSQPSPSNGKRPLAPSPPFRAGKTCAAEPGPAPRGGLATAARGCIQFGQGHDMATLPKDPLQPPRPPLTQPPSRWRRAGLGPTLLALLIILATCIILGAVIWLHKAGPPNQNTPTQPGARRSGPGMAVLPLNWVAPR